VCFDDGVGGGVLVPFFSTIFLGLLWLHSRGLFVVATFSVS
jgi:hypothetical protein